MCVCVYIYLFCFESHSVVSNSLRPHGLYSPWNSPGQNTGVGCHALLQEIFPTQGSNPGLPHCRQILYQLSHYGSPTYYFYTPYIYIFFFFWGIEIICVLFANLENKEKCKDYKSYCLECNGYIIY